MATRAVISVPRGRARRWCAAAVGLVAGAPCGGVPAAPPLSPEAQRLPGVTIVLAPLEIPAELPVPPERPAAFDSLLEAELRAADIAVVSASQYLELWNDAIRDVGGFYDPFTGARVEDRFQEARRRLTDELRVRFQADAVLFPEIGIVMAPYGGGVARWDGAAQGISPGRTRPFEWGVEALSLIVVVESLDGAEVYRRSGGLQVVEARRDVEGGPVDPTNLLRDPARNRQAIRLALDPLLSGRSP